MKTIWLFVLIVWAFVGYYLFPDPWASAMSFQGLALGVLLWHQRGPAFGLRWFVCLFGADEAMQVFVWHLMWNWWRPTGTGELGEAYTHWPLFWYGMLAVAFLTYWIANRLGGQSNERT